MPGSPFPDDGVSGTSGIGRPGSAPASTSYVALRDRSRTGTGSSTEPRSRSTTGSTGSGSGSGLNVSSINKKQKQKKKRRHHHHRGQRRSKRIAQQLSIPDFDKLPAPKTCCEKYRRFIYKQGLQIPDLGTENEYLATTHTTTVNRILFAVLGVVIGSWFIVRASGSNVEDLWQWLQGSDMEKLPEPNEGIIASFFLRVLASFVLIGSIVLGLSNFFKMHKCVAIASQVSLSFRALSCGLYACATVSVFMGI